MSWYLGICAAVLFVGATLLLVQRVQARVVMELLGHSQISLTMNTYSHVLPGLQTAAAAQLDELLLAPPSSAAVGQSD